MRWFEYCGNFHVHSHYSDGAASPARIARIAGEAGLDFVIITDHGTLRALNNGEEGYYGDVLVLVGSEANRACNHYVALDIAKALTENDLQPQSVIDQVNTQAGIGIIAHPMDKGSPFWNGGQSYPWLDWSVQGFQGLELWNLLSQLMGSADSLWRALGLLLIPHRGLKGPDSEVMTRWDAYHAQGIKVLGFGSSDAHGSSSWGKTWPLLTSYQLAFRSINLHVLTDQPRTRTCPGDRALIYKALRQGRFWISDDYYWKSTGFTFTLTRGKDVWTMGDQVPWQEGVRAVIKTPGMARVRLIRDGRLYASSSGSDHSFPQLPPGVYRIEVNRRHFRRFHSWIFSNPIWLTNNPT